MATETRLYNPGSINLATACRPSAFYRWIGSLAALFIGLLLSTAAQADSCTSQSGGNWSAITWSCGHLPTSADDVTIADGHVVTLDVDAAVTTLTICDNVCDNDTTLTHSGSRSLAVSSWTIIYGGAGSGDNATWDIAAGTANATNIQFAPGSTNAGRTADITLSTGTLNCSYILFNGTTGYEDNQRIVMTGAANLYVNGSGIANLATADISPGTTSTSHIYTGAGGYLPLDTTNPTYANLEILGNPALNAAITTSNVTGNVTLASGTLDTAGFAMTGNTGKTFQVNDGFALYLSGSTVFPTGFSTYTLASTSTVAYEQNVNTTISAQAYGHLLILPKASNVTLTFAGGSVSTNNFQVGVMGGFGYTGTIVTAATNATALDVNGDMQIDANCTFTANTANTLYVGGGFSNGGTFNPNGDTVVMDTSASGKTVNPGSSSFNNLTFNGTGSWNLAGTFNIPGVLNITAGTVNSGVANINLSGGGTPFLKTGSFNVTGQGTFTYLGDGANVTASSYYNLALKPSGGTPQVMLSGNYNVLGAFIVGDGAGHAGATAVANDPTITVQGDMTIAASAGFVASDASTLTLGGNFTNSGTFTHSNGTVVMNASASGKTVNPGANAFYNLTFNNASGGWTFSGNPTIANVLNLSSGTLATAAASTLTLQGTGTPFLRSGTFNPGANSAVDYTGNGATSSAGNYYNLGLKPNGGSANILGPGTYTVTGTFTAGDGSVGHAGATLATNNPTVNAANVTISANAALTMGSGTLNITGSGTPFTKTGTFNQDTSTVNYTGSGATTVTAATYNNLGIGVISDALTGVTYTLGGSTIVNGSLVIGNASSTNSDTFSQGAANNLTTGAVTVTTKGIWSNTGTGDVTLSGNVTNAGAITLDANGAGCGQNDDIAVTSSSGGSVRTWSGSGTFSLRDLAVSDMGGSRTTYSSTNSTPGTNTWTFSGCGVTVAGTIYTGEGSGPYNCSSNNLTVAVKVNGISYSGTCTLADGSYSIPNVDVSSAGDVVTVFLDGETEKAVAVTRAASNAANITGLDLYQNRVIVRHEDAGPITNANLDAYDSGNDADVKFTVTNGALTVADGSKLLVWAGKTFEPGGSVTTDVSTDGTDSVVDGDLGIQTGATLSLGTNTLTVGGDFDNAGTFSVSSGQLTTFNATAAGFTLTQSGSGSFYDLVFAGGGGGWTLPSSITVANDFTISSGNVTSSSGTLTVSGNFYNYATFTHNSGTVLMNASATDKIIDGGSSSFNNLTFNNASGSWTALSDLSVAGNLTMTSGSLTGGISLTVGGSLAGNGTILLTGPSQYIFGIKNISSGGAHTCAVSSAGRVYCWGTEANGRLGNAATGGVQSSPVLVQDGVATGVDTDGVNLFNIKQVSAGGANTCVLSNSGKTYCWGLATYGMLGTGSTSPDQSTPVLVVKGAAAAPDTDGVGLTNLKGISVGDYHTCAVSNSDRAYCWGNAANGKVGNGDLAANIYPSPVLVQDGVATGVDTDGTNLVNIKSIECGQAYTCALANSGKTYCWGYANYGSLGNGATSPDQSTPVLVLKGAASGTESDGTNLVNIKTLSLGTYHTCAVGNSGKAYCWGYSNEGELGYGSSSQQTTPVRVQDGDAIGSDSDGTYLINIASITAGNTHSCAIANSGKTYCWGYPASGQLGDNQIASNRYVPVQVLRGVATGSDTDGTYLMNMRSISAGMSHTCALSKTGRVYCWGLTNSGQVGNGVITPNQLTPALVLKGAQTETEVVTMNGTGNMGGNSAWSFYSGIFNGATTGAGTGGITFENTATINNTKTLNGGTQTWNFPASGTPLVKTGSFNGDTSTVNYTGTSATTIAGASYNNLNVGATADGGSSVTYTLGGHTTVSGNLTIGNAASTNSDTLDQGAAYNLTTGPVTVTSKGVWTDTGTGDVTLSGNVTNNGQVILDANGISCGQNDDIALTSSAAGVVRTWSGSGTFDLRDLNVSDMGGSRTTLSSTNTTPGTNTWTFAGCGVTVSGTIYTGEGSGPYDCSGNNLTVAVRVNGTLAYSGTCTLANGTYSIPNVDTLTAGAVVTVYLDGETEKATTVTRAADATSNIAGLDLYQNRVIVRHEDTGPITNANLDAYDSGGDADIKYAVTGGALTVADGSKLLVWSGKTFTPGGAVSTDVSNDGTDSVVDGDVGIQSGATLAMGVNTLTVGGDFDNAGTFSKSSGQQTTFTASAAGFTLTQSGSGSFYNLTFQGNGGWTLPASLTVDNDFINGGGTVTSSSGTLTVSGNFFSQAAFVHNSGTVLMDAGTTGKIVVSSSSFNNLAFNNASGGWVLGSDISVAENLTMTAGTLTGVFNLTIAGNLTGNGTILLTGPAQYLYGMKAVSAGDQHTCAVSNGGQVYCWGNNVNGRLGNGVTGGTYSSPVQVQDGVATGADTDGTNLVNIKSIAAGYSHTCAVANSGKTYCWGAAANGRLGNGATSPDQNTPVLVQDGVATGADTDTTNLVNQSAITTGYAHTCSVSNSGKTYCWGYGLYGQLGDAGNGDQNTPVLVQDGVATGADTDGTNLVNMKAISAGYYHTCATANSGKAYCWGYGINGQLGDNQTASNRNTPVLVEDGAATGADTDGSNLINLKTISAGYFHTCAITNSGKAYCWGYAQYGRLGNGDLGTNSYSTPSQVRRGVATGADSDGTYLINMNTISGGQVHTCASSNSGKAYCWGVGSYGELGNGTTSPDQAAPVLVQDGEATGPDTDGTNLSGLKMISSGGYHNCALSNIGYTYCWGTGSSGQLGNASGSTQTTPVFTLKGAQVQDQTVTLSGTGNFGGASAWEFNKAVFNGTTTGTGVGGITFGTTATINNTKTLNGGTQTYIFLASGTPFVKTGTFNGDTSTVNYTGTSATTVAGASYNNLNIGTTSDNGAGVTYTLGGNTTVTGALTIGNAASTNTDTFDQGATYNLTTGAVTVTTKGVWTNIGSGDVTLSGNVSNSGSITLDSSGVSCGGAKSILLTSSLPGTVRSWSGTGLFILRDLDVSDMGGTLTTNGSNNTTPGTNTWNFVGCGVTLSGTIYTGEGSGLYNCSSNNLTVAIKVNGTRSYSGICNLAAGTYSIPNVDVWVAGDVITAYLDGETEKAVTVTRAADNASNVTNLDLYQNRVIVRHEDAGPITNTDLDAYDGGNDADIKFTVSSGALTVADGSKLLVWSNKTFTPGGAVATDVSTNSTFADGDVGIQSGATLSMGTNMLTVGGDFSNAGTFSKSSGQQTVFTGTGTTFALTQSGSGSFYNLLFQGGGWTLPASLTVDNDFNVASGTVTSSSGTLTVGGSFINQGTFTHNSGTVLLNAGSGLRVVVSGASSLNNLTFNNAAGNWILGDDTTVSGNLTMTAGTLTGSAALTVGGNLTGDGSILLTGTAQYLYGLKDISAGVGHTCALTASGRVYCWGQGAYGELGNNTTTAAQGTPVAVEDGAATGSDSDGTYLINVKGISAGYMTTCAVANSGKVYCWGYAAYGSLGNGATSPNQLTPALVQDGVATGADTDGTNLINIRVVSTGGDHTCAIANSGKTYCWGAGGQGQLGNGGSSQTTPVLVQDGEATGGDSDGTNLINLATISLGSAHTCASSYAGKAYCWGYDLFYGLLGNGATGTSTTPVLVRAGEATAPDSDGTYLANVRSVVAAYFHSCAVTNSGKVYCWGNSGGGGQLGNGSYVLGQSTPVRVQDGEATGLDSDGTYLTNIQLISSGSSAWSSCAVSSQGRAYCWGSNTNGQLGNGAAGGSVATPVKVQDGAAVDLDTDGTYLADVRTIDINTSHTCSTSFAGRTYCWGAANDGRLGNNDTSGTNYPAPGYVLKGAVNSEPVLTMSGTGNLGGASAWEFYRAVIDGTTTGTGAGSITVDTTLTINNAKTLNGGTQTYNLAGSGTPFVKTGTFTANTSSVNYTGSSATTITVATYNNLGAGTTSDTTAGVTYTLGGNTTVSGTVTIGNASSTNSDILDQGANFNLNPGAVTVTAKGVWNNTGTGDVTLSGNVSNAGTINLDSGGSGCGQNDDIALTSSVGGTVRTWSGTGVFNLRDLNVSDMGGSQTTYSSTNTTPGTNTWTFSGCGVTISGNIYTGEGSGAYNCSGNNLTVALKVNGNLTFSGTCTAAGGGYSIPNVDVLSPGAVVTAYLDGETEKAVTVTRAANSSSSISGLDLYQNRVIARHEDAGPITNADLDRYDSAADSDIKFTVSNNNLTVSDGSKLLVWAGKNFTPGGTVTTDVSTDGTDSVVDGDLGVQAGATLSMGTNLLTVGGDFDNAGTFSKSSGQLTTFAAQAAGFTLTQSGSGTFYDLVFASGGGWTLPANFSVDHDLIISEGTLTSSSNTLTVSGSFINQGGTFTHNSGTLLMDAGSTGKLFDPGTSSLNNVTFNNASGGWVLAGAATVAGNLTMTAGALTGSANLTVAGNLTGNGTILLTGSSQYFYGVKDISAGGLHTCALATSGRTYCWGTAAEGELGNGQTGPNRSVPALVLKGAASGSDTDGTYLINMKTISAGNGFTCAAAYSGKAYCWGYAAAGVLGNGDLDAAPYSTPVLVLKGAATGVDTDGTNLVNVKMISAADYHTCAVTNSGKAYCWGAAVYGRLGNNATSPDKATPVLVEDGAASGVDSDGTYLANVRAISAGEYHTCAVTNSGKAYCWGETASGQVGDNQTATDRITPVLVEDGVATGADSDGTYLTNIRTIAAGNSHSCAVSNAGKVYCWGLDTNGQLGDGSTAQQNAPVQVQDGEAGGSDTDGTYLANIKSVMSGNAHSCALSNAGKAYCWGNSSYGQLGNASNTNAQTTPVKVQDGAATGTDTDGTYLVNIRSLSTGELGYHTCVASNAGKAYCWGKAAAGLLGNGTMAGDQYTPVSVLQGPVTENPTLTLTGTGNLGGSAAWQFYKGVFNGATTGTGTGGVTFDSDMTINGSKTLNGGTQIWTVNGAGTPFVKSGTFNADTSTFVYGGSGVANVAPATYNNLTVGVPSKQLNFDHANQTNVSGSLTISGQACSTKILLRSDLDGFPFTLNATGSKTLQFVDVKDSTALTPITATYSRDSGNNTSWTISYDSCSSRIRRLLNM